MVKPLRPFGPFLGSTPMSKRTPFVPSFGLSIFVVLICLVSVSPGQNQTESFTPVTRWDKGFNTKAAWPSKHAGIICLYEFARLVGRTN